MSTSGMAIRGDIACKDSVASETMGTDRIDQREAENRGRVVRCTCSDDDWLCTCSTTLGGLGMVGNPHKTHEIITATTIQLVHTSLGSISKESFRLSEIFVQEYVPRLQSLALVG
jgi:hypothetical protein